MQLEPLHDRIRMLCAKAIMTPSADIEPVIEDLRAALREHARRVRPATAKSFIGMPHDTSSSVEAAD